MATERQIQSARANGARSRGPVTPEGKQKSSRNAIRHGILANTVALEGESKERFEELLASLTAEWQPRNTTETALVETMAAARWRWLRVLAIQKMQFDIDMARQPNVPSPLACAAIAFKKLSDNSRTLDVLLRYEVAFDRQFYRALNTLMKLRASANVFETAKQTGQTTSAPARVQQTSAAGHPEPEAFKFPNEPDYPLPDSPNPMRVSPQHDLAPGFSAARHSPV
jgi:hypothetical protein